MIDRIRARTLLLSRRWKRAILVVFDFTGLAVAMWISFCLRFDRWHAPQGLDEWAILISAPIIALPIFFWMQLYRSVVRFLPERAILTMLQAMLFATLCWVALAFLSEMAGRGVVPRSVPIIYFSIGTLIVVGGRFAAKWIFLRQRSHRGTGRRPVIIYGAGETGIQLAHSLEATHDVVGFIDDKADFHGRVLAGIRVYPLSALPDLVTTHGVSDLIMSISSLSAQRRKEIVGSVGKYGLKVLAVPSLIDLATGKYPISHIKEVDVVDLLGRSAVPPDQTLIRNMVFGRSIMVTGAGGSIGSELCRKLAIWNPRRLVLFEANEHSLYQIERELAGVPDIEIVPILGSVVDRARVEQVIVEHNVGVIFHAAAHKHVPLVEANVLEGMKNNVFGTKTVVEAAHRLGVEDFVLISTDKAVRPTNVMGATKRWAELIIAQTATVVASKGTGQRFCAVRFGNVLGSNGSVVPLFRQQIAQGGPVTLTDAAMTRYFMSIQEAAELIVQAGALSEGGDVFLLDMGEPMLIADLAENMIRLSGLTVRSEANPKGDIEIRVTGKRPGEKLYEELFYDASTARVTQHPKIMRAAPGGQVLDMSVAMDELAEAIGQLDEEKARGLLFSVVARSAHRGQDDRAQGQSDIRGWCSDGR